MIGGEGSAHSLATLPANAFAHQCSRANSGGQPNSGDHFVCVSLLQQLLSEFIRESVVETKQNIVTFVCCDH